MTQITLNFIFECKLSDGLVESRDEEFRLLIIVFIKTDDNMR